MSEMILLRPQVKYSRAKMSHFHWHGGIWTAAVERRQACSRRDSRPTEAGASSQWAI
jgi:hypothetical protein